MLQSIDSRFSKSWWGRTPNSCVFSPSQGRSGGVCASWDVNALNVVNHDVHPSWIQLDFMHLNAGLCTFITTYCPTNRDRRVEVLQEIEQSSCQRTHPVAICGDFNEVLCPRERKGNGSRGYSRSMLEFQDWVNRLHLIDIKGRNQEFTWFRNNSASCLDRCFINSSWSLCFPETSAVYLEKTLSGHQPLLISLKAKDGGLIPFRSLDCWLEAPSFKEAVKLAWNSHHEQPIHMRLKSLKKPIRKWNCEIFGNMDSKINEVREKIDSWILKASTSTLTNQELSSLKSLELDLSQLVGHKERIWKQKSRCQFIKEGDRNTAYFHKLATVRRRGKRIEELDINGKKSEDPKAIRTHIRDHFKSLYSMKPTTNLKLEGLGLNHIGRDLSSSIERSITPTEVKQAVWSCDPKKAPGYDGFNFGFI